MSHDVTVTKIMKLSPNGATPYRKVGGSCYLQKLKEF